MDSISLSQYNNFLSDIKEGQTVLWLIYKITDYHQHYTDLS
jgi:hypothetical protein